jgi:hypothetical protein
VHFFRSKCYLLAQLYRGRVMVYTNYH